MLPMRNIEQLRTLASVFGESSGDAAIPEKQAGAGIAQQHKAVREQARNLISSGTSLRPAGAQAD